MPVLSNPPSRARSRRRSSGRRASAASHRRRCSRSVSSAAPWFPRSPWARPDDDRDRDDDDDGHHHGDDDDGRGDPDDDDDDDDDGDGSFCIELTESGCIAAGGGFQGDGTVCADTECKRNDPPASSAPSLPVDVNGDGVVDAEDLIEILLHLGECGGCAADVNGDDIVDRLDMEAVLGYEG